MMSVWELRSHPKVFTRYKKRGTYNPGTPTQTCDYQDGRQLPSILTSAIPDTVAILAQGTDQAVASRKPFGRVQSFALTFDTS